MKRKVRRVQIVQPTDLFVRYIPLTRGQFAIVDAADFDWLNQWNWCAAWAPHTQSFYAQRAAQSGQRGATIKMHREILGLEPGDPREGEHKEPRETLDNRRSNLRIATHGQNMANRGTLPASKTGLKGASPYSRSTKFVAQISYSGKKIMLGHFDTPEEAHSAYVDAARKLHGKFARAK